MKRQLTALLIASATLGPVQRTFAQASTGIKVPGTTIDSTTRGKYTLVFINKQPDFDTVTERRMVEAFYTVYPKEADRFNRHTARRVVFIIDPGYDGVAATSGAEVQYNPLWLKHHPEDIDVVTHEVMHIVQAYNDSPVPGWLTEGIADYVRAVYGVNNRNGGWALPNYKPGQSYTDAYRVTARFLLWVEANKYATIVDKMDKAARDRSYTPQLWAKLTGKTVDQLWEEYTRNPIISGPLSHQAL